MKTKLYVAVCLRCYTCQLCQPTTKREAELTATSHTRAYGHDVSVQEASR